MKITTIGLLAFAVLQSHSCSWEVPPEKKYAQEGTSEKLIHQISNINRETAIAIATRDAKERYGSLQKYVVVDCEGASFWHVFFEPADSIDIPNGIVYYIEKRKGLIVTQREFIVSDAAAKDGASATTRYVKKDEAVAIAKRDGFTAYGSLEDHDLTICELGKVWAVEFSQKEGRIGGGPEYIIDKATGRILDKKYYQ